MRTVPPSHPPQLPGPKPDSRIEQKSALCALLIDVLGVVGVGSCYYEDSTLLNLGGFVAVYQSL